VSFGIPAPFRSPGREKGFPVLGVVRASEFPKAISAPDPLQNMSKHWRSHARLLSLRDGAGKGMFGGLPASVSYGWPGMSSDLIRGSSPAMT